MNGRNGYWLKLCALQTLVLTFWMSLLPLPAYAAEQSVLFDMNSSSDSTSCGDASTCKTYPAPAQILVHDHEFTARSEKGIPHVAIRHMGKTVLTKPLSPDETQLSGATIPIGLFFGGHDECNPKQPNFLQLSDSELGFFISTQSLSDCKNFKRVRGGGQNIVWGYEFLDGAPTNIWRQTKNKLLLELSAKIPTHNVLGGTTAPSSETPIAQLSLILSFSSTSLPKAQPVRYVIPFFDSRGTSSHRVMSDYDGAFFISSSITGDQYTEGDRNLKNLQNNPSTEYQDFRATISSTNIIRAIQDLNIAISRYNRKRNSDVPKIPGDSSELKLVAAGILVEVLFNFDSGGPAEGTDIEDRGHITIGGAIKDFRITEVSPDGELDSQPVQVYGHYSPIIKDHFYSRIEGEPVRLGYLREGPAFYVYSKPTPSSQKLFRCANKRHHFLSTARDCGGAVVDSVLGWVRSDPGYLRGSKELFECSNLHHKLFTTDISECERKYRVRNMGIYVSTAL